jgi:hypothetical protein
VVVSSPWHVSGRCAASGSNVSGVLSGMDGGRDAMRTITSGGGGVVSRRWQSNRMETSDVVRAT